MAVSTKKSLVLHFCGSGKKHREGKQPGADRQPGDSAGWVSFQFCTHFLIINTSPGKLTQEKVLGEKFLSLCQRLVSLFGHAKQINAPQNHKTTHKHRQTNKKRKPILENQPKSWAGSLFPVPQGSSETYGAESWQS